MADKQTILNNLLTSLERLSDHYSKLELNGLNPADRQTVLNDIGTIQTKLEQIIGTQDSLTSSEIEALREEYQALVDNLSSTVDSSLNLYQLQVIDSFLILNNIKLVQPHKLFRQSSNLVIEDVMYIVAGDSTRDNTYNEMKAYYISQLAKINVNVFYSSRSGGTAKKWFDNTQDSVDARLSSAIAATTGVDGENTIFEYSYGLNDYYVENGNKDVIKASIKNGLLAYKTAKPKAFVFLAYPVATGDTARDTMLDEIYSEVAHELNLFYVNTKICTESIKSNPNYYADATHPNKFGSRRIVNFILNEILPLDLFNIVTLEEYIVQVATDTSELNPTPKYEVGNWYTTNGGDGSVNTTWRRTQKINIEPNFNLLIEHRGNRYDALFYDINGDFLEYKTSTLVTGNIREVTIPTEAYFVAFNIISDGANYDLLNDVPSVKYDISGGSFMSIDNINIDLKIRNRINPYVDGIIIDGFGKKGIPGQVLTIDSNNKMKWQ
jgi:hypothetical protein